MARVSIEPSRCLVYHTLVDERHRLCNTLYQKRQRSGMRSIEVRLHRAADLAATMTAMRVWLDDHQFEPSRFACDRAPGWFLICVDFNNYDEAQAFKSRFGGSEK